MAIIKVVRVEERGAETAADFRAGVRQVLTIAAYNLVAKPFRWTYDDKSLRAA